MQPTFIIDYPLELSLYQKKEDDPSLVERFELFVGRKELANAYTELNDPIDQKQRFEDQVQQKKPVMKKHTAWIPILFEPWNTVCLRLREKESGLTVW